MNAILTTTIMAALVLALSLLIERLLELLKSVYDLADNRFGWKEFWDRRARKLAVGLQRRLRAFQFDPERTKAVLRRLRQIIVQGDGDSDESIPVISGDLVRALYVKIASVIVGVGLGIGLAFWMRVNIIDIYIDALGVDSPIKPPNIPVGMQTLLTGVVMGLGAGPVHKLVTTIDKKQEKRRERAQRG